ncbi:unnamed protein product [Blepharisma stoltei]|uniref:EF-hand domain-containing protein n=1 Tax=Blepharisma stoltei TaxID=1481888 RepID=A0AAU9KBT8_9CILI|nr:unnamed protein product [Blepharisma stoltei]
MEDPVSLSDTEEYSAQEDSPKARPKNQELLVMTVEIGDGRQDIITISENDDPFQLAHDFAMKHKLDKSLQQSLAHVIRQNKELVEKRANSTSPDLGKMSDFFGSYSSSYTPKDNFLFETNSKGNHAPTINPRSKALANKRQSQGSVYDRLYRQGAKPSKSVLSNNTTTALTKSKTQSNINYGEWLYIKGLKQKEALLKNGEAKRQENESKELMSYSFKPQINKFSSLLSPRNYEKTEDLLNRKAEEYKERLADLKAKVEVDEMKECTFTPAIKETSWNRSRTSTKPIHEELFSQASRKKEKQIELEEESIRQYSFRPEIHVEKKEVESTNEFIERLVNSKKKVEEELEAMRLQQQPTHDESTGQRLFHPQTYSKTNRNEQPIWEHLYSLKDEKQKKINEVTAETQTFWNATAAAQKASAASQKIFKDFRIKQYQKLFSTLDSDNDGKISSQEINIDDLDGKNLAILTPIFNDIETSQSPMEFPEFAEKLEELCNTLTVEERAHLLKRETIAEIKQQETSQEAPVLISEKSIKLAEKSRSSLPEDIYERSVMTTKLNQLKLAKQKEMKEHQELQSCTFRPSLKSK